MLVCDRSDDIVRLISLSGERLDTRRRKESKYTIDLRPEIIRHTITSPLVLGIYLRSETGTHIGRHDECGIRILCCESLQELRYTEYSIHILARSSGHLRNSEEHPIYQIVGVDDEEGFFRHF